jgi:hypothetical protein
MPPKYGPTRHRHGWSFHNRPRHAAWRVPSAARSIRKYHCCGDFLRMSDCSNMRWKVKWNRMRSWYQADRGTGRNTEVSDKHTVVGTTGQGGALAQQSFAAAEATLTLGHLQQVRDHSNEPHEPVHSTFKYLYPLRTPSVSYSFTSQNLTSRPFNSVIDQALTFVQRDLCTGWGSRMVAYPR